mmetsp:Transcript_10608/g.31927  ORF Transcript_10608/g.31927 Transcript_10608/m.31927 type:complete len:103 (-) Transcript_10608:1837-2145(-)
MVWHRLPTFLPNVPMRLIPFNKAQKEAYEATGFVRTVAFRTLPSLGKLDIKTFLQRVYGLDVVRVQTLNVEGKKKRSNKGFYRLADYKKAYVTLRPPSPGSL